MFLKIGHLETRGNHIPTLLAVSPFLATLSAPTTVLKGYKRLKAASWCHSYRRRVCRGAGTKNQPSCRRSSQMIFVKSVVLKLLALLRKV